MKPRFRQHAHAQRGVSKTVLLASIAAAAIVTAGGAALLVNIFERNQEAKVTTTKLVEVTRDTTDPALWGVNWPKQYGSYLLTAQSTRTRFGGHGGSEALPQQKIDKDPWLKRMFLGYAFSIDYRDRRGHAYMLQDQENTQRQTKPQTGSCLHCHASIMPLYRQMGGGDAMKGFEQSYKLSYKEMNQKLHDMGHGHTVTCADCHDPKTMQLIVTRPAFINGIQALAGGEAATPYAPSIERWRAGGKAKPYDPNTDASRSEMRTFVCAQCHIEYYCSSQMPLTAPWGKGLNSTQIESFWDGTKFASGERFFDYKHAETGAPILKAQHPEFEMWSQGVHARSGVACADCHMPYGKEGGRVIRTAVRGARAAAQGAMAAGLRRGRKLHGLPRAAGSGQGAGRGDRLRAARRGGGEQVAHRPGKGGGRAGPCRKTLTGLVALPEVHKAIAKGPLLARVGSNMAARLGARAPAVSAVPRGAGRITFREK
ncbi:MAG: nrfA [Ramlibacter sp.]|nr:nrfA [Ramlibacter sp.]